MKCKTLLPAPILLLLSAATVAAEDSATFMIDAGPCLGITRAIERLQCFEDQVIAAQGRQSGKGNMTGASSTSAGARAAQSSASSSSLPVVSIPRSSRNNNSTASTGNGEERETARARQDADSDREDRFGLAETKNTGVRKNEDGREELVALVAQIKELNPNRMLITLENGQVWEQMKTERFALEKGDEIRIYPHRWGSSYRLSAMKHSGFIQVERLK